MKKKKIIANLHSIISACLCGPAGDPDDAHRRAAALAVATLVLLGERLEDIPSAEDLRASKYFPYDYLAYHGL